MQRKKKVDKCREKTETQKALDTARHALSLIQMKLHKTSKAKTLEEMRAGVEEVLVMLSHKRDA